MFSATLGRDTVVSLDGEWGFVHASDGVARRAQVPGPWQAEFADLRLESGRATYRRDFAVPAALEGLELSLHFGAVSYFAEVSVNGVALGSHEGGYLPFECVIPSHILKVSNEIVVSVVLPDGDEAATPDFPFAEIPHGKQSWYGPLGGLWQSVLLVGKHKAHLQHCRIVADWKSGDIAADLELSAAAAGASVQLSVLDPAGQRVASAMVAGTAKAAKLAVGEVKAWSPSAPNLYRLAITVMVDGVAVDETVHIFGFRHFEARDGKFFLNGEPFYMRGALDQDYYPQGICTPPSVEFLEDQFCKAKELGLNLLRCHIKVPDPRYYEVADRMGMLVWTEIPNVARFTDASARRMIETMEGILRRDFNHPSIVIWTLINEDWGTRLHEDASHRAWLKQTFDWLKAQDPTRLVVDNSPCNFNFHVKTDINDYHYYRSVPERRAEWDRLTEEFAAGADWTFSPTADIERRGDEPLVVSEFGVWGLPDVKQLVAQDGGEPWWMETGASWGDGAAYPHGIENRFAALRLSGVFGSFSGFIEQIQWYQFNNLKYEIEVMRAHAPIQGYVITELTDVHWEANGLMDINRNKRIFHEPFAAINADLVIVPRVGSYACSSDKAFEFGVSIATGGASVPQGAQLRWALERGASGVIDVPQASGLAVVDLDRVSIRFPDMEANAMLALTFELVAGADVLARNSVQIASYAPRKTTALPTVFARDLDLAQHLQGLGYALAGAGEADIQICRALDAADIAAMQGGKRYLVLADGSVPTHRNLRIDTPEREAPFMPIIDDVPGNIPGSEAQLPNINLINRQGTMWRGDWIASFSWIRRQGAFASLPGGPMLDLSFDRVVPHHVMTGFRNFEFGGAVHAGLVVGWVHKPAAMIAERRVGKGGLVATTFRLTGSGPGADPVADALLDAVIATAMAMDVEA